MTVHTSTDTAAPIYFLHPNAHWGGCLTAVCRGDMGLKRIKTLEKNAQLRVFRVRATVADAVPLIGELPDLLKPRPFPRIRLNEDPLQIYVHHGGWNAVYYTLVGTEFDHVLDYVQVAVKTKYPRSALSLGRTAIGRLLDSEAVNWQMPVAIPRLDLLADDSDDVIVSEIVMPYPAALAIGPLGGLDQSPLFTPWLATLREAITATNPYWRLLCSWRVYDGLSYLRGRIKKRCEALGVNEPMPKDPDVSLETLRAAGIPNEFFKGVKKTRQLFSRLHKMRDGVAHFLLKEQSHVYFSDGQQYWQYSIASTILLQAAMTAVRDLYAFYSRHVETKTRIGSVLPEKHHADKWIVYDPEFCPPLSEKDFAGG